MCYQIVFAVRPLYASLVSSVLPRGFRAEAVSPPRVFEPFGPLAAFQISNHTCGCGLYIRRHEPITERDIGDAWAEYSKRAKKQGWSERRLRDVMEEWVRRHPLEDKKTEPAWGLDQRLDCAAAKLAKQSQIVYLRVINGSWIYDRPSKNWDSSVLALSAEDLSAGRAEVEEERVVCVRGT